MTFCHLHAHSDGSLLDGMGTVDELVTTAERLGQPALALTDHGTMNKVIEFYDRATLGAVKPIIGLEAYTTPNRHEKGEIYHLTLLAENETGYKNLMALSTAGYTEGFYRKPRVDIDLLAQHSDGVICLSGCMASELSQVLLTTHQDGLGASEAVVSRYRDIFADRYYLEVQDHGLADDQTLIGNTIILAKRIGVPLVATNDAHYVTADQAPIHEIMLCTGTKDMMKNPKRMKFDTAEFYLKSRTEMESLFGDYPEALDNTLVIAERCNLTLDFGRPHLPQFTTPGGMSSMSYLRGLVIEGLARRYGATYHQEPMARATYELDIIESTGFADYFLLVWDVIRFARERGIAVGPGRGSGAGSIVAYALFITGVDPLAYDLSFERFLNPERISMPDMDLDFADDRRHEVFEYVANKYGSDHVAGIITIGTIGLRMGVRDVFRALDYSPARADELAKLIPPMAKDLDTACQQSPELKLEMEYDAQTQEVLGIVSRLAGRGRHASKHAAGVVIGREPLAEHVPLATIKGDLVTQYDMGSLEKLGLLKMDFLGLRTLSVIEKTRDFIEKSTGKRPDMAEIDLSDPKIYEIMASGETFGVFQFDSYGMRKLLKDFKPSEFRHIVALVALYRPGPMQYLDQFVARKTKRERVTYRHPVMEEVLGDTYGIIVYQEQVMQLAARLGGYSMGQADLLRKAMGKKKPEVMAAERTTFVERCVGQGLVDAAMAEQIFDDIEPFAGYAFNRCVAGDTLVSLGSTGSHTTGTVPIQQLYARLYENLLPAQPGRAKVERYGGLCLHCQREDRPAVWRGRCAACQAWIKKFRAVGLTAMALDADGRIRPKRIKDVHYNGARQVFRVTLNNGSSITSTANHRHMTTEGWKTVTELKPGDMMLVMGPYDGTAVNSYRTSRGEPAYAGARLPTPMRQGENALRYIDGSSLKLKSWSEKQEWVCAYDGCPAARSNGDRIERAHLDGDRTNNDPSNLLMLCASHHKAWDYATNGRRRKGQKGYPAIPVPVISIEDVGREDVYDLEMDDPGHNWVGNNIVTHNSHSTCYGLIAAQTAWLKGHYPKEFMAALLSCESSNVEKMREAVAECRRLGIRMLDPDVNRSMVYFVPESGGIRYGLASLPNVGKDPCEAIVAERAAGAYLSPWDFCCRLPGTVVNKRVLDALIDCRAMSTLMEGTQLRDRLDGIMAFGQAMYRSRAAGQYSLLDRPITVSLDAERAYPPASGKTVCIDLDGDDPHGDVDRMVRLYEILLAHPGNDEVEVAVGGLTVTSDIRVGYSVTLEDALVGAII